jgi:ATP-binding cassette subfamily C protein CydD
MAARGPVDPRLLRYASGARWFLGAGAVLGLVQTASIVAVAWFAASGIAEAIAGRSFVPELTGLVLAVAVRAATMWALEATGARAASVVKSQLRTTVLAAITRRGPGWMAGQNAGRLTTVVGRGLDALDGYFGAYLPQLIMTAVAVPVLLLVLGITDIDTAIIVVLTLPVIPVFMALVGWATRAVQRKQWNALTTLASGFLEVVEGLSTLTIFGRQRRQTQRIAEVTEQYRERTMAVLRVTFVSGFVLEVAGSLSVAIVAVTVGIRLVNGTMPLVLGLFVLLLTPEVYLPIRQVGARFHASADGVAAAEDVFEILEGAPDEREAAAPAERSTGRVALLELDDIRIAYDERVVIDGVSARFETGRVHVIAGPSGVGKSSLVGAMLGFVPFSGSLRIDGQPVPDARHVLAWASQRPSLTEGTIAENVAMGHPDAALLRRALHAAAAEALDPTMPLGPDGAGLSGGQAQRVAIARAAYRALSTGAPFLVLDEPTSALDAATEALVVERLRALADEGFGVVLVSHRPAVLAAADSTLVLDERVMAR